MTRDFGSALAPQVVVELHGARGNYKPLRDEGRLSLDEGACLPLRSRFGQCRACESVCPVVVLAVSVERVSLAEGCTGCGRCVAACPNDALRLEGFAVPASPAAELECSRVPASERSPHAQLVPCLGGLSAGRLAQLAVQGRVELIDRGWCASCPSGGGRVHPAQSAIDAATLWLDAVAPGSAPALAARPLPLDRMQGMDEPKKPSMSRREFFRAAVQRAPMGCDGRAAFPARERRPSAERARLLGALGQLSVREEKSLPAELFPRLANNGACADYRICTAACPTGALTSVSTADGVELRFSAEHCIACGACARACPEEALSLEPHGGQRETEVIARHRPRACSRCGDEFTAKGDETVCAACSKAQRFMNDAMRQLFGARS